MRVLFAGLFHETHTFLDEVTGVKAFSRFAGKNLLDLAGDLSPMGAALDEASRHGITPVAGTYWMAMPGGTVSEDVLESYWHELLPSLEVALDDGLDGIFLVLHGAMATASCDDVEGEVLRRIRAVPGCDVLPIFGVFDLHANFSPHMAHLADGLCAYHENPHTDAAESARRAVRLLHRSISDQVRPRMEYLHSGIVWVPLGIGTENRPMRELAALARDMEQQPDVWEINVVPGYAYADTEWTGLSFSIVGTLDGQRASALLEELSNLAWELREAGQACGNSEADILAALETKGCGPVVIAEPSDNIGAGAPGDGTGMLRFFLNHHIPGASVAINDSMAVAALRESTAGQKRRMRIGGRGSRMDAGPMDLEVELIRKGAGKFILEDPHSHLASMSGLHFDMGDCAVVQTGGVTILLTSNKTPPFDLGQWRSQGVEPATLNAIAIKAAVAHRRAYESIARAMLTFDTPGPCPADPRALPYRRIRRPVYPLDD
jgi:microcystin degradation protein MlrC